jgi:SAM-dependent methyltransferase
VPDAPDNRVSPAYAGAPGSEYFRWQSQGAEVGARLTARRLARWVGEGESVLDFGCGSGQLLAHLAPRVRIGVEPNPAARAAAAATGATVHACLDEVDDASVDVVVSNHALEHTLQPRTELVHMRRVLRPGGRLVLVVPLDDWRSQRDPRPDRNNHLYAWTPRTLANLARDAGFRVVACNVVTDAWPPGYRRLARLPAGVFNVLARATALLLRRRQLLLVAEK